MFVFNWSALKMTCASNLRDMHLKCVLWQNTLQKSTKDSSLYKFQKGMADRFSTFKVLSSQKGAWSLVT